MVSAIWAVIAASSGLLAYLLPAALAPLAPMPIRVRVGRYYGRMAARSYRQFAVVRRLLGGYDILPVDVDDAQKLAQVTLDSGLVSADQQLQFGDPDNRISRLYSRPVALVVEGVPAAVDAELAELGYWTSQHETGHGLETAADNDTRRINPYIRVPEGLRAVDPRAVLSLVSKDTDPENIKTAVQMTKKRYEKYGGRLGMAETAGTLMGFAVGIGGVAVVQYIRESLLDGAGTGGSGITLPMGYLNAGQLGDLLVVVL